MNNAFFKAFNGSNKEAERVMGEPWIFNDTEFPAIAIEKLTKTDSAMLGGRYVDMSTTITIRKRFATQSMVKKGSIITARGERLRVSEIDSDGDDSLTLLCGPVGIETPRR